MWKLSDVPSASIGEKIPITLVDYGVVQVREGREISAQEANGRGKKMYNPYDDNYPIDVLRSGVRDLSEALEIISERLDRIEYIIHRIEEIKPDIAEINCAGCKYLFYGKRIGVGATDDPIPLCGLKKRINRCAETDGRGCYKWRRRKK